MPCSANPTTSSRPFQLHAALELNRDIATGYSFAYWSRETRRQTASLYYDGSLVCNVNHSSTLEVMTGCGRYIDVALADSRHVVYVLCNPSAPSRIFFLCHAKETLCGEIMIVPRTTSASSSVGSFSTGWPSLPALTTVFTPPASCSDLPFTSTDSEFWRDAALSRTECYPPLYLPPPNWNEYSPGVCPARYTPNIVTYATYTNDVTETYAFCCP